MSSEPVEVLSLAQRIIILYREAQQQGASAITSANLAVRKAIECGAALLDARREHQRNFATWMEFNLGEIPQRTAYRYLALAEKLEEAGISVDQLGERALTELYREFGLLPDKSAAAAGRRAPDTRFTTLDSICSRWDTLIVQIKIEVMDQEQRAGLSQRLLETRKRVDEMLEKLAA
jgi:hypothetical protein